MCSFPIHCLLIALFVPAQYTTSHNHNISAVDYALTSVLKKAFAMFGKTAEFWGAVSAIGSAGIITFVIDLFQHCTFLKRRGQFSWWRLLEYGITCAFPKAIATAALATAMATFLPLWVAMITFFGQLLHHQ